MGLLDLIRVELARRRSDGDPLIIVVKGGLPNTEPSEAKFGDTMLSRETGESLGAFEARTYAAAMQAGAEVVVIGGLLEREW